MFKKNLNSEHALCAAILSMFNPEVYLAYITVDIIIELKLTVFMDRKKTEKVQNAFDANVIMMCSWRSSRSHKHNDTQTYTPSYTNSHFPTDTDNKGRCDLVTNKTFCWWILHWFPNTSKLTNSLTFRRNALSLQLTSIDRANYVVVVNSLTIFPVHSLGQRVSLKSVLYLLSSETSKVFFLYEVALILLYRRPCAVNEPLASHDRDALLFYRVGDAKQKREQ